MRLKRTGKFNDKHSIFLCFLFISGESWVFFTLTIYFKRIQNNKFTYYLIYTIRTNSSICGTREIFYNVICFLLLHRRISVNGFSSPCSGLSFCACNEWDHFLYFLSLGSLKFNKIDYSIIKMKLGCSAYSAMSKLVQTIFVW